jgi:hypothetical protein
MKSPSKFLFRKLIVFFSVSFSIYSNLAGADGIKDLNDEEFRLLTQVEAGSFAKAEESYQKLSDDRKRLVLKAIFQDALIGHINDVLDFTSAGRTIDPKMFRFASAHGVQPQLLTQYQDHKCEVQTAYVLRLMGFHGDQPTLDPQTPFAMIISRMQQILDKSPGADKKPDYKESVHRVVNGHIEDIIKSADSSVTLDHIRDHIGLATYDSLKKQDEQYDQFKKNDYELNAKVKIENDYYQKTKAHRAYADCQATQVILRADPETLRTGSVLQTINPLIDDGERSSLEKIREAFQPNADVPMVSSASINKPAVH